MWAYILGIRPDSIGLHRIAILALSRPIREANLLLAAYTVDQEINIRGRAAGPGIKVCTAPRQL